MCLRRTDIGKIEVGRQADLACFTLDELRFSGHGEAADMRPDVGDSRVGERDPPVDRFGRHHRRVGDLYDGL